MFRLTIPVFSFFKTHRAVMWTALVGSFLLFVILGLGLRYEEDILKLLPQTEMAKESGLAFGQLAVKDKITVQFVSKDGCASDASELASACDDFVSALMLKDTASHYVRNVLYRLEPEWMLNGLDWGLGAFPAYLEESAYAGFDSLLTRKAIFETMASNAAKMAEDFDGNLTSLICYDPAGLRYSMKNQLGDMSGGSYIFLDSHLFSPDSTIALAFVAPKATSFDSKVSAKVDRLLESTAAEFGTSHPDVEVMYHGATERSACNSRQIKSDLALTLSLALLIIVILLSLVFRNLKTIVLMLVPIAYGTFFAMACIFLIKGSMSLMALGIGAVVLGIAVSYVLHVLMHFKYTSDAETVLREQSTPVCMSCLTTIGAFAGLLFTQSELLRDFGIFACFMLVGSTFAALVFLPQFFNPENNVRSEKAFRVLDCINSYPIDRKYGIAAVLLIVMIASMCFSNGVGFDSDLQNINYCSPVVDRSEKLYAENINKGLASVFYASKGASLDQAIENNAALVSTLDSLKNAGVIEHSSSFSGHLVTESRQQMNIERWKSFWTPERLSQVRRDISDAAVANSLDPEIFDSFFLLAESDYYPSDILESGVLPEELASNFVEKVGDEYLLFSSALMESDAKKAVGDCITSKADLLVVDPFYYASDMVEMVHSDYSKVLYISSLFVLLVLLLTFMNVPVAVLAFLPMFLSWYVVQGIMAVLGIEFNLINIVISSFVFGVGVDYSIFIMDGLIRKARGGDDKLLLFHKSAILLSAVILIVVVALLLLAKSPAISSVGAITLIGMASTILMSYCLMPLAFRLMMRVGFIGRSITGKKTK